MESGLRYLHERKRIRAKELVGVKTVSIRLEDTIYEELSEMLEAMGQTKQTFYESFTRTALRERSIPFIISAPAKSRSTKESDKLAAFARLEASRKSFSVKSINQCSS